ncbi:MAG: TIGR03619 family F420-dependent LLM class oxidoreductase [Cellvibrionales bacterium]|nr:TIGR03619 family F420-dependent LLM class oxidoreductase [Cellvibrionales bacterium]
MRFSYHACMCPPDQYQTLAQTAEKLGFDGFTLPDSICYPEIADTKYPYNADGSRQFLEGTPFIEPFVAIPYLAATTEKIRFTTSVTKLPIRNPVILAKQLTSMNHLIKERFAFGVGISPWKEDFEICGVPWEKRGKRMDEMIAILRGFHSGEYFSYEGEFFNIPACKMNPVPKKTTPILIGGHADLALKRAAKIGDGWIHAGGDSDTLKGYIDKINHFREAFGTLDKPFEIHAITADSFSVDGIKRLEEIGVTECIVGFRDAYKGEQDNTDAQAKIDLMNWYKENIMDKC